jgi:hypothetical protein
MFFGTPGPPPAAAPVTSSAAAAPKDTPMKHAARVTDGLMILFFIRYLLPGGMVNLAKGIKTDRLIQLEQGCLHLDSTNTAGTVRGPGILPFVFILQTYSIYKWQKNRILENRVFR